MAGESESETFFSIIALLSKHSPLPELELVECLDVYSDGKFSREEPGHFYAAVIPELQYLVFMKGCGLTIHNYAHQYFDGPEVATHISDSSLANAVAHHTGWISVDWTHGEAEVKDKWDTIGNVLAHLPLDHCIGIFIPDEGIVMPIHEGVRAALGGSDVMSDLGFS
ncbi:hypothetical protein JIN77_16865 [Verrucomicrobiaceae bacterium R5-34]|uniref:Uncharacterized protein n=1 Tax=Oceaniferula flava TaxID=2800421 RepID=A0AAE2SEV6_9BACT|nr:hypothetical protein [Oceaniferula flavus]MBK1832408.1 hypothetical protein [Verrucomicrobiaceae bacterium R5-34]MBK1855707.1 hypothetical protein [Oceaniferula flavus]MBM1137013.1 hypothetical protein [Oceaniferula flavus]